ncbi:MAG: hypothetical protein GTN59_00155 [Candidatus Dadabacteria bacterium]|nr:hypothetical protein [Candidatus Dadabacteria bacterium]
MNIRKIIREEIDDFDWVRGVNPTSPELMVGNRYYHKQHTIRITNITDDVVYYVLESGNGEFPFEVSRKGAEERVKNGMWELVLDITESTDDFNWIREEPFINWNDRKLDVRHLEGRFFRVGDGVNTYGFSYNGGGFRQRTSKIPKNHILIYRTDIGIGELGDRETPNGSWWGLGGIRSNFKSGSWVFTD